MLRAFAHPRVAYIFYFFALLVALLVVGWGLLVVWAMLGLFLRVDNGWNEHKAECVALAQLYNQTLTPDYIPKPPDAEWGWSMHRHAGSERLAARPGCDGMDFRLPKRQPKQFPSGFAEGSVLVLGND